MKMNVLTVFSVFFCTFILFLCAHTIWKVMLFLSSHEIVENSTLESNAILFPLWCNANLILMFILQHSFLKTHQIANYLSQTWARSIYIIFTCLMLQVLVLMWKPTNSFAVWRLDSPLNPTIWWVWSLAHVLAWASIYGGTVLLDLPELLGIKQIYYYFLNVPETSDLKSTDLQRLYSNKRHPSFIGLLIILWFTPVMSLDRLLLAVSFSLYSCVSWEPTIDDKRYHKRQLMQKKHEIEYLHRRTQIKESECRNFRG